MGLLDGVDPQLLAHLGMGLLASSQAGPQQNLGANLLSSLQQYSQAAAQKRHTDLQEKEFAQRQKLQDAQLAQQQEMQQRQQGSLDRVGRFLDPNTPQIFPEAGGQMQDRQRSALLDYGMNVDPQALGGLLNPSAKDFLHGNAGDSFINPNTGQQFDIPINQAALDAKNYFTTVDTPNGIFTLNTRTGQYTPAMSNGKPLVKSSASPELQGNIAGARKSGELLGQTSTQAKIDLPAATDQANYAIDLVSMLKNHPGMEISTGKSSLAKPWLIPGTDAADFKALLDQVNGKQFLEAYSTLKGTGQITEIEGQKATQAIARMQTSQTEGEFRKAADEFIGIIKQGQRRAVKRAGGDAAQPASSSGWSIQRIQ